MNIIICDDDERSLDTCHGMLSALSQKHNIDIHIYKVNSGKELLFSYDTKYQDTDLIYLDYNMADLNGIHTAYELRENGFVGDIIFYSVEEWHAIEAFDVEAFHYIVKNVTDENKFESIFLKAYGRYCDRHEEYVSFSCAGEHRTIAISKICYFEVQNRIITIHYIEKNKEVTFDFYSTLAKVEEFLYQKGFLRIHKSYLVAERFIASYNARQVVLNNNQTLPLGKSYRKVFN